MSEARQAVEGERNSYLPSLWAEIAHLKAEHNDLLQILAKVRERALTAENQLDQANAKIAAMTVEHETLRCELTSLVKVLAFYADKENWRHQPHERMPLSKAVQDGGHLAREALGMLDA